MLKLLTLCNKLHSESFQPDLLNPGYEKRYVVIGPLTDLLPSGKVSGILSKQSKTKEEEMRDNEFLINENDRAENYGLTVDIVGRNLVLAEHRESRRIN